MPDLDLRMGLYRRLGELEDRQAIDAFAAELIDRFGTLPAGNRKPAARSSRPSSIASKAMIAKLDVGAKGAVVTFAEAASPTSPACSAMSNG